MMPKRFLTLHEAAEQISRSYWRLREDAIKGQLTFIRYNPRGKIYVRQDDLDAYIERHRVKAWPEVL